tara:strand:+ start:39 stop:518 length:480 start_codon:yes stop_codon:yes gene_type:complete
MLINKLKALFSSPPKLEHFITTHPNIELVIQENTKLIQVNKSSTIKEINNLISVLKSDKYELAFHDTVHPTLSDPGAYFSYSTKKSKNGYWSMTYGNHGWAGGIFQIKESTVAYQIYNLIQKGKLNQIQITNVVFFNNFKMESTSKSVNKDKELFNMHQ